ncbi:MAG: hypothetical protein WAM39_08760 [Bryobacteraceae bacterium]
MQRGSRGAPTGDGSPSAVEIFESRPAVVDLAERDVVEAPSGDRQTGGKETADFWQRPFTVREVVLSSVFLVLFCAVLVASLSHYPYYPCCFHQLSAGIRHWDFRGLDPSQPKELWGYSYLSALVAAVTRLPDIYAIVVVSSTMFVVANYLCCRLWGTTVAAWFMVVSWWWLDGATEGMTEPLFMALVLGSFLAFRKGQWVVAAVLASGATVVRPTGIFVLGAIGMVLLLRREWRRLAVTFIIGLIVGILYAIPMKLIYGDALANVHGYQTHDWSNGFPVTIPLLPEIKGAFMEGGHLRLKVLITAWVLVTLVGLTKMATDKRFWRYSKIYPVEAIFAGVFAIFLFCYNAPYWAWLHFPRFVIPLIPFLLLVFLDRLPRDRRIVWTVAGLNIAISVLAKVPAAHWFAG